MPEEINDHTNEEVLDEMIKKAFEKIAEAEYQEFLKQEKEWEKNPPHIFSKRHERMMEKIFQDYAKQQKTK